jgi:hypothetical protein
MKPCNLIEFDWNFDKVPKNELIACCFWEYARESAFIRDVRQRCLKERQAGGKRDEQIHADLQKLQSIGYPAEVFMRGFFREPGVVYQSMSERLPNWRHPEAPPITGNFPQPWQTLSGAERTYRACISSARTVIPLVPFKRGERHDARDIAQWADSRWHEIHSVYEKVRREYPEVSEVTLVEQGKLQPFPGITPSLLWESGKEFTVVAIDWGSFTNDEIANYFRKWVKANRPPDFRAPNKQGRKHISDRVKLERLAIMRLLHRCSVAELRTVCPAAWKLYNTTNRRWRKDVEKAYAHFREFLPFLRKNESPRSWPPKEWPDQMK